jgi:hypothetical protein
VPLLLASKDQRHGEHVAVQEERWITSCWIMRRQSWRPSDDIARQDISLFPFSHFLSEPAQTAVALAGDAGRERRWGGAGDRSFRFRCLPRAVVGSMSDGGGVLGFDLSLGFASRFFGEASHGIVGLPGTQGCCSAALLRWAVMARRSGAMEWLARGLASLRRSWRRGRAASRGPLLCFVGALTSPADVSSSASSSPPVTVVVTCWIWWICLLPSARELLGSYSSAAYIGWFHRPVRTQRCRAPLPLLRPSRACISTTNGAVAVLGDLVEIWRRSSWTGSRFVLDLGSILHFCRAGL